MIEAIFLHRRCGEWSRALDINQPLENVRGRGGRVIKVVNFWTWVTTLISLT